jgi:PAS domain S-box-containing protein
MDSHTSGVEPRGIERGASSTREANAEQAVQQAIREKDDALSLLDVVLESAPVGFALHDRRFRITRANGAIAAFLGVSPADLHGRTLRDLLPDHAAIIESSFAAVMASGTPEMNVEMAGRPAAAPGRERHWLTSVFPVRKGSSAVEAVGLIIVDTTDRKALEGQLLQAQKMEAIGRLAGGIAHDFNNMLTAVMSYSDLLLQDLTVGDPRREDVAEIASAARRAAGLTRQLLAFSRQQVLQAWPLDLNTTVVEIQKLLGRLIGADVEVQTHLEPRLGIVKADPGQIEQVLMNLAVNARDAMADGGRLIIETANVMLDDAYVRTHPVTAPGEYVRLTVSDTGSGMSPETQARIFEPFFTTKERGKGTGLGLSTVYGIVKQSGGCVWVYSEPGSGTTFKIYLPRVDAVPAEVAPPERRASGHQGSEVILLVEDDAAVRTVVARILRAGGYAVVEAANGAQALRICENPAIGLDLIITDIVMPEMGGREFARLLRELRPDSRMLFMSGYTEYRITQSTLLARDAAFIEKPFTMDALAKKVRDVLEKPATPSDSAS